MNDHSLITKVGNKIKSCVKMAISQNLSSVNLTHHGQATIEIEWLEEGNPFKHSKKLTLEQAD